MTARAAAARSRTGPPAPPVPRRRRGEQGSLSLEAVMTLPVVLLCTLLLFEAATLGRDVLLVHEAARAGARAAATSTGSAPVVAAARAAAPELELSVEVTPVTRRDGDVARVTVSVRRRVAGTAPTVRASAVARVEPGVGGGPGPDPGAGRSPGGGR